MPQTDTLTEQAVARVSPAIVKVENVGIGLGSGVIMSASGYVVTNDHVVKGAQRVTVTQANGTSRTAKIVGQDPVDDLAVLKIAPGNLRVAQFGNSANLIVGQTVIAIGNPLGITQTATTGIVSALNRAVSEGSGNGRLTHAVQTSAPINPGNSGGALVDLNARVIGIPTLTAVDPEFNAPASGIGFAIPSNTVKNIAGQLIKYGRVIHSGIAALQVAVTSVTPQLAAQYNLPVQHGVLIANVIAGGAAAKAGLKQNEIIVSVDGTTLNAESDLLAVLATRKPGDTVSVVVVNSSGKRSTVKVTLGELAVNSNG